MRSYMGRSSKYLKDVAKAAGVAPITLRRWLLAGKIPEVSRDRNGWRLFTSGEEKAVLRYATKTQPPQKRGAKR
jgi:DNA (cytosine-5)-methyltransferase 1